MQDRSKIIKDYKEKIDTLKKHNNYYYNKDNPRIPDYKYDELKKEILKLNTKY